MDKSSEMLWESLACNRIVIYRRQTVQTSIVNCIRELKDVLSTVKQMECGKGMQKARTEADKKQL